MAQHAGHAHIRAHHAGQLPLMDYDSIESPHFVRAATAAAAVGLDAGGALVSAAEKRELQFRTGRRMLLQHGDFAERPGVRASGYYATTRRGELAVDEADGDGDAAEDAAGAVDAATAAAGSGTAGNGTVWSAYDDDDGSAGHGDAAAAACAGFAATATGDISDELFGVAPTTSDELSAALEARLFGGAGPVAGAAGACGAGADADDELDCNRRTLEARMFGDSTAASTAYQTLDDLEACQTALETRLFGSTTAIAGAAVNAFMSLDDDLDASREQLETRLFGTAAATTMASLADGADIEGPDELDTARELLSARLFGSARSTFTTTQPVATDAAAGAQCSSDAGAHCQDAQTAQQRHGRAGSRKASRAQRGAPARSNFGTVPTIPGYNPSLASSCDTFNRGSLAELTEAAESGRPLYSTCRSDSDATSEAEEPADAAEVPEAAGSGASAEYETAMPRAQRAGSADSQLSEQRALLETRLFGDSPAGSQTRAGAGADLDEQRAALTARLFGTARGPPMDDAGGGARDDLDVEREQLTARLFGTAATGFGGALEQEEEELDMDAQRTLMETRLFGPVATGAAPASDERDDARDLLATRLFGRSDAGTWAGAGAGGDAEAPQVDAQAFDAEVAAVQREADAALRDTQAARSVRGSRAGDDAGGGSVDQGASES